ncbi:hypothetical protein [Spirochaeta dissipatitropha]
MTIFKIKGMSGIDTYLEILNEESDGYTVHMHSTTQYGESDSREYISKDLFKSCLRTGYLIPVPLPAHQLRQHMRAAG